jgi:adenosylhomocysteine nucleosidase
MRRFGFVHVFVCAFSAFTIGCKARSSPSAPVSEGDACGPGVRVLLLSAFDDELEPLMAQTRITRQVRQDGRAYACGVLSERNVVLSIMGVGPERAARSTELALDRFAVSAVLVVGIAGGIARDVGIGDVTIPARWSRHDETDVHWYDSTPSLLSLARGSSTALQACEDVTVCAAQPKLTVGGNGVTGAHFIANPAGAVALEQRLNATVTDMETAVVAEMAQRRRVPFIAIRAVSDVVRSGRSRTLVQEYSGLAAGNAASVALALLRSMPPG